MKVVGTCLVVECEYEDAVGGESLEEALEDLDLGSLSRRIDIK